MRIQFGRPTVRWASVGAMVSLALIVTGLPAQADPTSVMLTVDDAAPDSASTAERPDSVSAMVTARMTGHRVEDLSQRDETTRVFANPGGTWTSETASEPERVQDAAGTWHEIDTELVARGRGLAPAYAASDVVFSAGGDSTFASLTEDGRRLAWRWPGRPLPKPVVAGNTATYHDVAAGEDLVVTATATGFTHNLVLTQPPTEPVDFSVPIVTGAASLEAGKGGSLNIVTPGGDTLAAAPRPLMWDSSADRAGQPQVRPVDTSIGRNGAGTPTLTLAPDADFLSDPGTVYPVTVDPSFTVYTSGDAWLENPGYTSGQASSAELRVGTYDGGGHVARAFMHFDGADARWAGKHVVSAKLVLRNFYSGSCTGAVIRASRIASAWDATSLTWANQPNGNSTYTSDYKPAHGYNSSCDGADATWDVTDMAQPWANWAADHSKGYANNGIKLKAPDETSSYTWRRYRSANYGTQAVRPHINVTYNSYPNTPGSPTVTPGNPGYATSTTPTLRATVSDPDKSNVRGTFEIYQGSTLKWTGTSPAVSSGSSASVTVPVGKLSNGEAYSVKLKATDGTDESKKYSASTSFTVDTSKPAVTVTSSAFANGQWATEVPASNTFTFTGPGDAKSFTYTLDGVTQPTKAADSTGKATLSWLPKSGTHKLSVAATDKAGNTGATVAFAFGVGPASFTMPSALARSTGVFPVQMAGPPGATAAALSWRYAGQSTWNPAEQVSQGSRRWDGSVTTEDTGSDSGALLWEATAEEDPASTSDPKSTITAPALIELRGCFTYTGTPQQVCSTPRQVQLVPSAFGGNFPVTGIGPATVALFSGEMTLSEPDAVDSRAGVARTFSTFDTATATPGAFGPGWSTALIAAGDADAQLIDHRAKDRTFVLVAAGDSSQMFTPLDPATEVLEPTGPAAFAPAGADDGSRMVLDGTTVTLTRPGGSVTSWQQDGVDGWIVQDATDSPAAGENPETSFEFEQPGYPTWIAQTEPGAATTCTEEVQEAGCRGLQIAYTGTGTDRRVSHIDRVAAGQTPERLATYTYASGLLTQVCGPDPDGPGTLGGPLPPLCTNYGYDTTTVPGRTLLSKATPPGQQPWQFSYDNTGRLTTVTRPLDPDTNSGTGPATWTLAYDLSPTADGLADLSAQSASQWGQAIVPIKTFAVFTPDHVPSATPTSSDLAQASLWYTDAEGTTTNTAIHANTGPDGSGSGQWLVDTNWYDQHGNVVRSLDGAGRARALADPENREAIAIQASTFTIYNDDPNAETGPDGPATTSATTRIQDEYGPAHTATLQDGTTGLFRSHTTYVYDDQSPSLGGGDKPALPEGNDSFDLVVEIRHSASDAEMEEDHDTTVVRNDYAPIVDGDGNGWTLGTPTRVKVQLDDGTWSSTVTRYDAQGRQIETRQPGGSTDVDGAGSDAHATVMSYYAADAPDAECSTTAAASPERAAWVGMLCKTGPAAQPMGPSMPVTYYVDYDEDLQPTRVEEISGSTTRTTTTTYDRLGRPLTTTVADGEDTRSTTVGYDAATGLPASQVGAGTTVQTEYDTWARVRRYTDATGMASTTTYTPDGQVATLNDGAGTYTYTYDGASGEHRRLPTAVKVGLPGSTPDVFNLSYGADGAQNEVTYPTGMVARYGEDEAGVRTSLTYSNANGDVLLAFNNAVDVDGRVLASTSDASEQDYNYDALGRLVRVQDVRDDQCTTRTYGFSAASERTSFHSYAADTEGSCQTSTAAVTKTSTYDAANRIRNTGYSYDALGRTLSVPAVDTAPGGTSPLSATYYANDMIKQLTQTVDDGQGGSFTKQTTYGLDPTGRIDTVTNTADGAEISRLRYRFSDGSDAPTSIQTSTDSGATWATTRYLSVPGLKMAGSVTGGDTTYQIANLHGDIVATQSDQSDLLAIDAYTEADEYGNSIDATPRRYGWLGSRQRSTDTIGGMALMGARIYDPATGLFLSSDPALNGGANRYAYLTDPINQMDIGGEMWGWIFNRGMDIAQYAATALCGLAAAGVLVCRIVVGMALGGLRYIGYHMYVAHNSWSWRGAGYAAARNGFYAAGGHYLDAAWTKKVVGYVVGAGQHMLRTLAHKLWSFGWKRLGDIVNYFTWFLVDTVRTKL